VSRPSWLRGALANISVGQLAREPVAMLRLAAPPGLQGFSLSVSHALTTALLKASPSIRGVPAYEVANQLNEKGPAADYTETVSDFARSGILDRERWQRIGSALGFRFVLQPGLAEFGQVLVDRFDLRQCQTISARISIVRR
jgi:hypothetical protein